MSLQDESFPDDEFFDELDFSANSAGKRFQFPNKKRHLLKENALAKQQVEPQEQDELLKPTATSTTNNSSSSSADQNLSTESSTNGGRASSGLSEKTSESDPTGLVDKESKKDECNSNRQSKAFSCQDIHSEYTKRRYKHVESKVGQYIANMRAEDQKRRNSSKFQQFQRHRSYPEALSGAGAASGTAKTEERKVHSNSELSNRYESTTTSDADAEIDSSECLTGGTASSSRRGSNSGTSVAGDGDGNGAGPTADVDYAQLVTEKERIQSYSDYLQTRLDEEIGKNYRLKRNLDYMRIELTNCKDKLKKQTALVATSGGAGGLGGSRQSLQSLLYCRVLSSTATQTELEYMIPTPPTPPPPPTPLLSREIFATITPDTPDANKNLFERGGGGGFGGVGDGASSKTGVTKNGKSVASMQPLALNFSNMVEHDSGEGSGSGNGNGVLRQRTNSNQSAKAHRPNEGGTKNSKNGSSSSGDSAIDTESAEVPSLKSSLRKLLTPATRSKGSARREEEFIYYDRRSGRYATLETLNASRAYDENDASGMSTTMTLGRAVANKPSKKQNSLRRHWLRLFGHCTRCDEPNQTLDGSSSLQQTYMQIPLLEKSFESPCRNLR